jgi:hypothetical protein
MKQAGTIVGLFISILFAVLSTAQLQFADSNPGFSSSAADLAASGVFIGTSSQTP